MNLADSGPTASARAIADSGPSRMLAVQPPESAVRATERRFRKRPLVTIRSFALTLADGRFPRKAYFGIAHQTPQRVRRASRLQGDRSKVFPHPAEIGRAHV